MSGEEQNFGGRTSPATQFITSEEAGQALRKAREKLGLRLREVELASQILADRYGSEVYAIGLSRLSDIENRGLLPSIYRLYSLATIYRLDFTELMSWYGVPLANQATDANLFPLPATHPVEISPFQVRHVRAPLSLDPGMDLKQTTFLSRLINKWGPLPLELFDNANLEKQKIAYVGSEDWSMYPILRPGSLLLLEEAKKISPGGWKTEWERPIYFIEHRQGFAVGWCSLDRDRLIVMPHHSYHQPPKVFLYPGEADILGEVKGVAMLLTQKNRRPPD